MVERAVDSVFGEGAFRGAVGDGLADGLDHVADQGFGNGDGHDKFGNEIGTRRHDDVNGWTGSNQGGGLQFSQSSLPLGYSSTGGMNAPAATLPAPPAQSLVLANPKYTFGIQRFAIAWRNRAINTASVMEQVLTASVSAGAEYGAWIIIDVATGAAVGVDGYTSGRSNNIIIPPPPSLQGGQIALHVHPHPYAGLQTTLPDGRTARFSGTPSDDDLRAAAVYGPGFVVARGGIVYGYDANGY